MLISVAKCIQIRPNLCQYKEICGALHSYYLSADDVTFCAKEVEKSEKVYTIGNSKSQGLCILDGIVRDSERLIGSDKFIMFLHRLFTVIPEDLCLMVTAKL